MSGKLAWRYNANGDMESGPYTVTQWLGYYFATFELDGYDRLEARFKTETAAVEHPVPS